MIDQPTGLECDHGPPYPDQRFPLRRRILDQVVLIAGEAFLVPAGDGSLMLQKQTLPV